MLRLFCLANLPASSRLMRLSVWHAVFAAKCMFPCCLAEGWLMACRAADRSRAKYEMTLTVRSHIGADDDAFNAIRQREDEEGIRGICLQRNVVPTAALALKTNIASLAPHVLPLTELVCDPRGLLLVHFTAHVTLCCLPCTTCPALCCYERRSIAEYTGTASACADLKCRAITLESALSESV